MCGLGGAILVFGSASHRMVTDGTATGFTGSAGFNGIVAALFGGLHPLWTILSSFVFGGLLVGGNAVQIAVQVPTALIVALNGLVVVFVVSIEYVRRRSRERLDAAGAVTTLLAAAPVRARPGSSLPGPPPRRTALHPMPPRSPPGRRSANEASSSPSRCSRDRRVGHRLATPFLLASLGEAVAQRSGVLNLGVDGIMLLGAFGAYYTGPAHPQPLAAVLVAAWGSARSSAW